jgi:hypothetical protein
LDIWLDADALLSTMTKAAAGNQAVKFGLV